MKQFFDNLGVLDNASIPAECIEDCTRRGQDAAAPVQSWVDILEFAAPQDMARKALKQYGAWDDLDTATDRTINERVLWLACWELSERRNDPDGPLFILE